MSQTSKSPPGRPNTCCSAAPRPGLVISGFAQALVFSGGSVSGSFVYSAGTEILTGGGASKTTVLSGAADLVYSGGVATATVVDSGGSQKIFSGGEARSAQLGGGVSGSPGATEYVYSGGVASGTFVEVYATGTGFSSGTASGARVAYGGSETVSSGASMSGRPSSPAASSLSGPPGRRGRHRAQRRDRGRFSGGRASGTTISRGGVAFVYS